MNEKALGTAVWVTSCLALASLNACRTRGGSDSEDTLAAAAQVGDQEAQAPYHLSLFTGKVSYRTDPELASCSLRIITDKKSGKVRRVTFAGGTPRHEQGYFEVGPSDEKPLSKTPPVFEFKEEASTKHPGYVRIAYGELTEDGAATFSRIITTEIVIKGKHKDGFDNAAATEAYQLKTIGGIKMVDKSRETDVVECVGLKLSSEGYLNSLYR